MAPRRSARLSVPKPTLPSKTTPKTGAQLCKNKPSAKKQKEVIAEPVSEARQGREEEQMEVDEPGEMSGEEDEPMRFAPPRPAGFEQPPTSDLRSSLAPAPPPSSRVGSEIPNVVVACKFDSDKKPSERQAIRSNPCDHVGCDKNFARKSDLVRHQRIHLNIRPWACDHEDCGKTFIQRSAMVVHQRCHTGERPHKCLHAGCERAFGDSSSLARHRRIHTGVRPYVCEAEGCGKTFCRRTTLIKHIERHHTPGAKVEDVKPTLNSVGLALVPPPRQLPIEYGGGEATTGPYPVPIMADNTEPARSAERDSSSPAPAPPDIRTRTLTQHAIEPANKHAQPYPTVSHYTVPEGPLSGNAFGHSRSRSATFERPTSRDFDRLPRERIHSVESAMWGRDPVVLVRMVDQPESSAMAARRSQALQQQYLDDQLQLPAFHSTDSRRQRGSGYIQAPPSPPRSVSPPHTIPKLLPALPVIDRRRPYPDVSADSNARGRNDGRSSFGPGPPPSFPTLGASPDRNFFPHSQPPPMPRSRFPSAPRSQPPSLPPLRIAPTAFSPTGRSRDPNDSSRSAGLKDRPEVSEYHGVRYNTSYGRIGKERAVEGVESTGSAEGVGA